MHRPSFLHQIPITCYIHFLNLILYWSIVDLQCCSFQVYRQGIHLYIFIYFFFKKFFWCTVDLQCCANLSCPAEWLSYTHTYIIFFLIFFSIMVYSMRLDIVPALCRRTLLFIHSKCNSLHLPAPNFQSIPLPSPLTLGITSLFSVSVSLFLFYRQVHLCHVLHFAYKCYHMLFVFLFLTYFT